MIHVDVLMTCLQVKDIILSRRDSKTQKLEGQISFSASMS